MSAEGIVTYAEIKLIQQDDGIETRLMAGRAREDVRPFITGTTFFPVGAAALMQSQNCDEQITVPARCAVAEVNGVKTALEPMDTSLVPADMAHRSRNIWDEPLKILWFYAAAEVPSIFTETGAMVLHLSFGDRV